MGLKHAILRVILTLLVVSCGYNSKDNQPNPADSVKYFTVGSISKSVRSEAIKFLPLANYIAEKLDPSGKTQGRVIVTKSHEELADSIKHNKVDLIIDSPYPITYIQLHGNGKLILLHHKNGVKEYSTVIYTRKNKDINSLEELKGKIIAFDSPFSTSGYLLPKSYLISKGFTLQEIKDTSEYVSPDKIAYVFTHHDDNTLWWILRGKVHAGATDDDYFTNKTGDNFNNLKMLGKTDSFPRQLALMRENLPPETIAIVRTILLNIHLDPKGCEVMRLDRPEVRFSELTDEHFKLIDQTKQLIKLNK